MRPDISVCVARWDEKTAKKARKWNNDLELETLDTFLGDEAALVVEPAAVYSPIKEACVAWGVLALTEERLIFHSSNAGQVIAPLSDVHHLGISPPQGSFLLKMSVGELVEVGWGSTGYRYEMQTPGATSRLWGPLQEQVAAAQRRPTGVGSSVRQDDSRASEAISTADELRKLADLKSEGVISEEEFATAKAQLLGSAHVE